MKYGSDEYIITLEVITRLNAMNPENDFKINNALLAAQEHIAFLENELTEEATINGKGAQRELKLLTKITALETCIAEKDKALKNAADELIGISDDGPNHVRLAAESATEALALTPESVKLIVGAKEHVIEVAKWHIENWKPFLTTETLLAKALAELEALQRGEK